MDMVNVMCNRHAKSEVEEIKMTTGSYQVKVILKGEGEESERTKTVLLPSVQAFTEYVQDKFDNKTADFKLIEDSGNKILNMDVKSFMNTVISLIIMCIYIKQEKHIDKY